MGLWKRYLEFLKRMRWAQANMQHVSQKSGLYCPRCSEELSLLISGEVGGTMRIYVCPKCKYQGPGLNKKPKIKRKKSSQSQRKKRG